MYKMLIVDDEKMIRLGMKMGINWDSIGVSEVLLASSAEEAIDVIKDNNPQIIITDINMAKMSGLDLIKEIRKTNEETKVIVLSGYDKFEYARECLKLGVQEFLLKPIDEQQLLMTVKKQIDDINRAKITNENEMKIVRAEGTRRQIIVEKYMRDLVHNKLDKPFDVCPVELSFDFDRKMAIAILIPDVQIMKDTENNFRQFTIKNICMDLIDLKKAGISFSDDDDKIIIAMYADNIENSITESIQSLIGILKDEYDITPRVLLGSVVNGLSDVLISYNDALHLLTEERKNFHQISMTSKEQNRENIIEDINREFKQAMCSNLADEYKVIDIFEKFEKAIISYNLSTQLAKKWCYDLFSNMYFTYILMTGETPDNRLEKLIKSIINTDRDTTIELTRGFIKNLISNDNNVDDEVIKKARKYIAENIEKEISVTSLSEMFYLSPNYFSRLFKKVMNEGCNEYIIKMRIEKSKYLLETTSIKSGEIANMVGYNDTNYFSLAFKKHTGMSPKSYRETLKKSV